MIRTCIAPLASIAFLAATGVAGVCADGPLVPGARTPHFVGRTVDGKALNLASTRGRVTLLSFFVTTYKDEAEHMRMVERLWERYERRGLSVLSVALDPGGADAVQAFVRDRGIRHPVFLDPEHRIAALFGVRAAPALYLLDPKGTVVRYQEGFMSGDESVLAAAIEGLIDRDLGPGDHPDEGLCHCYAPTVRSGP